MAEYASAITGLLAVGLSAVGTIHKYSTSVRGAPLSMAQLRLEASALEHVLKELNSFFQKDRRSLDPESALFLAIHGCHLWLAEMQKRFPSTNSGHNFNRLFSRFKWPLDEEDTRQAAESIHRFVQIFNVVLDLKGFEILSKSQDAAVQCFRDLIQEHSTVQENNWKFNKSQLEDVIDILASLPTMLMELEDIKHKLDIMSTKIGELLVDEDFATDIGLFTEAPGITKKEVEELSAMVL